MGRRIHIRRHEGPACQERGRTLKDVTKIAGNRFRSRITQMLHASDIWEASEAFRSSPATAVKVAQVFFCCRTIRVRKARSMNVVVMP